MITILWNRFAELISDLKVMDYKQLTVWKQSRRMVNMLYDITQEFPDSEKYGLTTQIRRAAVSISANITEGCGRQSGKETLRFLFIARGSLYEIETHKYLALDQNFIGHGQFQVVDGEIMRVRQLLSGFIRYFKNL